MQSTFETTAERADRVMTVASGWGALVLGVLSLHGWVATGALAGWTRAGAILTVGLAVMWLWGCWPQCSARLGQWVRGGGLNTALVAIGLVACLIVVNTLVRRRLIVRFDLTKNQRFTLSDRSRQILRSLKGPVKATVFIPAGRSVARARDLFKQYEDASDRFTWTRVDPLVDQKTLLEKQPKLNQTDFTGAILEYNGKRQDVTEFTEKAVTSAILKMTRETQRKIVFLKGHGEPDPTDTSAADPAASLQLIAEDLKATEWPIETLDLYDKKTPAPDPADVAVLVIVGPKREFAGEEKKKIDEYLNRGGRVLLLLDRDGPTFSKFLSEWGIKTTNDVVIGQAQGGMLLVSAGRNPHPAVKTAQRVVFEPLRSVTSASPPPSGITTTELLSSGPASEVVPNYVPGKPVDLRQAKPGPTGIAVLAEKRIGSGEDAKTARLLVVGGHTWFTDKWTRYPVFFNQALGSSLINYLGEEDALVSIPPKDENTEQAFLTPDQGRLLALIHFLDFPLLALALAILVYLKRR